MANNFTTQIPENTSENLQNYLTKINESKKQLDTIKSQLQKSLKIINDILPEQYKTWSNHTEEYINKSVEQLNKLNITLTTEEKETLRDSTFQDIEEKKRNLATTNKIDVAKNSTDFAIGIYDTAVSALSRNLKKLNDISKTIKGLPVIKEEDSDAKNIRTQYKKQYEELIKQSDELVKKSSVVSGISNEEIKNIKNLSKTLDEIQEKVKLEAEVKLGLDEEEKLD